MNDFHSQLDQLRAELDRSDSTDLESLRDFVSLSSASDSAVSSALNPVQLPKDRLAEYTNAFFPRNRAFLLEAVSELATISGRINALFAFYRYCLYSARTLDGKDPEQQTAFLNDAAARIFNQFDSDSKSVSDATDTFLSQTGSGNMHVIVPSKRYPGGFDFQFLGSPGSGASSVPTLRVNSTASYGIIRHSPAGVSEDVLYRTEYLESYATALSQNVVKAGLEVLETLFPGVNVAAGSEALQRKTVTLPFSFDFASLDSIFYKHTGIVIKTSFMKNISNTAYKKLEPFFSPLLVRTPIPNVVSAAIAGMNSSTGNGQVNTDMSEYMTKEGLALDQTISLTMAITLPKDVASYVSQVSDNEKPSLLSLHNWVSVWAKQYFKRPRVASADGRMKRSSIPKYVLPLSKSMRVTQVRKDAGLTLEPGKTDDNNIYISSNGSLSYLPKQDARDALKNVGDYEKTVEAYLEKCFDLGLPPVFSRLPDAALAATGSSSTQDDFVSLHDATSSFRGKLLSYDWDYNLVITASVGSTGSMTTTDLNGSSKPDALTIGDYLGFDFSKDGEQPMRKSFADSILLMLNEDPGEAKVSDIIGNASDPTAMFERFGPIRRLVDFYRYCAVRGKVPGVAELISLAAGELGLTTLKNNAKQQQQIYSAVIDENLKPTSAYAEANDKSGVDSFLFAALSATMVECSGGRSSRFRQELIREHGLSDPATIEEEVLEHESYFDPSSSSMADFGRLYAYLGGMVFKIANEKLANLSPEDLFNSEPAIEIKSSDGKSHKVQKHGYRVVSETVMPLAIMFSKYVPESKRYLEEAKQQAESNTRNDDIDVDDIKVASCREGAQMFPHQVIAHKSLRNHPKFAILDVDPGGGKTSISLTDIGALVKEMNDAGSSQIKPLILCPDGLIKNWVDDMSIFTGNKWNMVPLNRSIMQRWGADKLAEMLDSAPANTIVVAGFNFLRGNSFKVTIGTQTITVSGNLEFIKRFGFDYIAIDESHKLKTKTSARHNVVKQLTTASFIRYLRILSGTIIADRVKDIVGQTALSNSHIFRDREFSDNLSVDAAIQKRRELTLNGETIPTWEVDTPQRARMKLSNYAAVVTMKRKEWAFMLPSPIETFHAVSLDPSGEEGVSDDEIALGALHQQLYDAVLQESVEELEDLIKKAKSRRATEDDDDDSDDDESSEDDMEVDQGDELGALSASELRPYLQRIERLVTNPMADPLAPGIFGAAGVTHYVSRKAKYIADLVDKHFNPEEWSKDKLYREHSLVSFGGKLYFSRKTDNASHKRKDLPKETQGVSPAENTDTWKVEPEGKIIIFCRYTNSVRGIYDALPSAYKAMAVKFTGEEEDKWSNLDAFVSSPDVKILIANEMGISEGHNLQMASRIIRVESPWGPGELSQSSSRIFRPDPKAAKAAVENGKPGELYRDVIFLDWVLADNTMEVAKQSRLIAKIFNKARFDEAENNKVFSIREGGAVTEATYADILDRYNIEEVSMSLDTLRSRASLMDPSIMEYVEAYGQLNDLTRQEFHEMRITQDHTMKDLPPQEDLPDFRKIQTPFVAGMKAPDVEGKKFISLKQFVKREGNEEFLHNPNLLIGKPVLTDLGPGQIVKVNVRYRRKVSVDENGNPIRKSGKTVTEFMTDENGDRVVDSDNPISSFVIKTKHDNQISPIFSDTGLGFIPLDVDNAELEATYKVDTLSTTKKDIRAEAKQREEEEEAERKEAVAESKRRKKEAAQAKARAEAAVRAKQRKQNIERGKPINAGIKRSTEVPSSKHDLVSKTPGADMRVSLHPASYHGFLVLEGAASDPDSVDLAKYDFKMSGPYVYVSADRWQRFDKILDYIEDNFDLSSASVNRLSEIQDSFEESTKAIYRSELAPVSSLPYFFATRKRLVKNKKEIRPYPIIMPDELLIAVDLRTCPAIRRHVGKSIPGAAAKWTLSEGNALYFARNKTDIKKKIKELRAAGYEIENLEELKQEVANLKFRASSGGK